MDWKEVLYTLINRGIISKDDLIEFEKLPLIRDNVFLDYSEYGYKPEKIEVTEVNGLFSIKFGLVAPTINRKIGLSYSFSLDSPSPQMGFINDEVYNTSIEKGWEMLMQIEVRAKKHYDVSLPEFYKAMRSYQGTFEERIFLCLKFIKVNYDQYAKDIIKGQEWDSNAWKSYM